MYQVQFDIVTFIFGTFPQTQGVLEMIRIRIFNGTAGKSRRYMSVGNTKQHCHLCPPSPFPLTTFFPMPLSSPYPPEEPDHLRFLPLVLVPRAPTAVFSLSLEVPFQPPGPCTPEGPMLPAVFILCRISGTQAHLCLFLPSNSICFPSQSSAMYMRACLAVPA